MWVLDLEDIEKCSGKIIKRQNLSQRRVEGERTVFHKDDILYSKLRPYLQKMLIADDEGICTPELIPFRTLGGVNREYILWFLRSPQVDYIINEASYGTKMPRVNTETMINLVVPLPPLAEQQRIVERLNTILPLCNELIEEI